MGQKCSILKCSYGKYVISQRKITVLILTLMVMLMYTAKYVADRLFLRAAPEIAESLNSTRRADTCEESMRLNRTYLGEPPQENSRSYITMSAAFMLCTVIGQIPSSIFSDLYGGRHVLLFGFLGKIITMFITPALILFAGYEYQVLLRAIGGFFEGFVLATIYNILAHWTLERNLTLCTTMVFNGNTIGTVLAMGLTNYLGVHLQVVLYVASILMLLLFVLCIYFVFSRPATHPSILPQEKAEFAELFPRNELPGSIPWKSILTDHKVWSLCALNVAYNWTLFVTRLQVPSYFFYILFDSNFNIRRFAVSTRVTTIVVSTILALLADYNFKKDYIPTVYLRSTYTGFALIVSHVFSVAVLYVGCNVLAADVLLRIHFIFFSAIHCSLRTNALDNSRHYAGTLCLLTLGAGQLMRAVLWIVFGYALRNQSYDEWHKALWLTFAISTFFTVMYFDASRGERAPWDVINPRKDRRRAKSRLLLFKNI